MSNLELYKPLLEKIVLVDELKRRISDKTVSRRYRIEAKTAYKEQQHRLDEDISAFIVTVFDNSDNGTELISQIVHEFDALIGVTSEEWHPHLEYLKERLIIQTQNESNKSPFRRIIERNMWWMVCVTVIVIVVYLKLSSAVEVTSPIESKQGIIERSLAYEKLVNYDDWVSMDDNHHSHGVRKGQWMWELIFWPIKPTDKEIDYAAEFAAASKEVLEALHERQEICIDEVHKKDIVQISSDVWEYIHLNKNTAEFDQLRDALEVIAVALISKNRCT